MTHQKIESERGLGNAKDGNIANGGDEYAIGDDSNDKPLAQGDEDDD
jgi:hypothetical protein